MTLDDFMNYLELKALAHRADFAKGEERKQLVEELMKELPKLDPFEGVDEFMVWLVKLVVRVKWVGKKTKTLS